MEFKLQSHLAVIQPAIIWNRVRINCITSYIRSCITGAGCYVANIGSACTHSVGTSTNTVKYKCNIKLALWLQYMVNL